MVDAAAVLNNFNLGEDWITAVGGMVENPDGQITFLNTGGIGGEPSIALDYPSVQMVVRGKPNQGGYDEAYRVTRAMLDALLGFPTPSNDYPELISVTALGHINELPRDTKGRPSFTQNFRLIVAYETSGYRT